MNNRFAPLLSPAAHVAGIAAAVAIIGVTAFAAGNASEEAVHSAQVALNPAVRYIVLQPVAVVARKVGEPVADTCSRASSAT